MLAPAISIGLSGSFLPSFEDRVADGAECDRGGDRAEPDPQPESLGEQRERLVEEHGLEPLAVHRGEAQPGERDRRARGHRARHPRAHELHAPAVLEPRDQPEVTTTSTTTAISAVTASSSSRLSGAMSMHERREQRTGSRSRRPRRRRPRPAAACSWRRCRPRATRAGSRSAAPPRPPRGRGSRTRSRRRRSGAATPFAASSRSTASRPSRTSAVSRAHRRQRRAVADVVAQLGELNSASVRGSGCAAAAGSRRTRSVRGRRCGPSGRPARDRPPWPRRAPRRRARAPGRPRPGRARASIAPPPAPAPPRPGREQVREGGRRASGVLELALGGVELDADRGPAAAPRPARRAALDLVAQVGGDRVLLPRARGRPFPAAFNLSKCSTYPSAIACPPRRRPAQRGEGIMIAVQTLPIWPALRGGRARLRRGLRRGVEPPQPRASSDPERARTGMQRRRVYDFERSRAIRVRVP